MIARFAGLGLFTVAGVLATAQTDMTCARLGAPYFAFDQQTILNSRVPTLDDLHVPADCKASAEQLRKSFIDQDTANMQSLVMRACSAQLGWVEIQPGICQAGGPPPICVAGHWRKDPNASRESNDQFNKVALNDRVQQIQQAACSCFSGKIQIHASTASFNPYDRPAPTQNPYTSVYVVPCSGDQDCTILPGYSCQSGKCQKPQKWGVSTNDFNEAFAKRVENIYSEELPPGIQAAKDILENLAPTQLGTWGEIYSKDATDLDGATNKLRQDYSDLAASSSPEYSGRSRLAILSDIDNVGLRIDGDIDSMKLAASGIDKELELGRYGCYDLFDSMSNSLIHAAQDLNNARPSN